MSGPEDLRFHHGAASVPDLEQAIEWYGRVFGFEVEARFPIPAAAAQVAMLVREKMRMELFEVAGARELPRERRDPHTDLLTHGNKHVAFSVPDVDAFMPVLERENVDIAMEIREKFGRAVYIRDCAGNLVEIVEVRS